MIANYEVCVVSVKDDVPAYLHVEFERYEEAVHFAHQYDRHGSTPSIYNKVNDYYLMIGGLAA